MQNRGALWIFTILLALACAYQLSFSIFTSSMEKQAATVAGQQADSMVQAEPDRKLNFDSLKLGFENRYLSAHSEEQVYPVLGYSYRECKEKEINLGLDLKGGMAVTLEVSIPELIEGLSENSDNPAFTTAMANARKRQLTDNADFVTLFGQEYAKIDGRPPLSAIFYSPDRQAMFEREGSDDDYLNALRREAESALSNTERILRTRIDKFGVAQPGIQKQAFSGRILIELPGVKDKERVRKVLQSTANLEFWETHDNAEIGPILDQVNAPLSAVLYPGLADSLGAENEFKHALPGGFEVTGGATGVESQLVGFIAAGNEVDKETWFNFDRVTFKSGSAEIDQDGSAEQLGNLAEILKAYPSLKLKIGGYTDSTGSETSNQKLSQQRAEAVVADLRAKGIAADRLEAEGYGSQHPVASNATEEGRAQNRRMALRVLAYDAAAVAEADAAVPDSLRPDSIEEAEVDTAALRRDFAKRAPLAAKLQPLVSQRGWMRGATVGMADVADTAEVKRLLAMEAVRSALPRDVRLAWGAKQMEQTMNDGSTRKMLPLYALKVPSDGKPKLDGSAISSASQDFDMKGSVEVRMSMNPEGAQTWAVMTADNVGKQVAIVLDGLVYSAPEVRSEIRGGQSSIEMGTGDINKQIQEAEDLANILKAGALPAPARIIDETVVGPSLGAENVNTGMMSFFIALLLVMVYMALYYARAGWVADLALIVNLFVLIGSLASLQAALTLPGIAGIVLTMGMAVDANVLIYERVREELRHGKMLKSAVDLGYKGALSAIVDGNVTTLIIAVILLIFGSGPVQGFAVTLGLGILTSLFTALFLSRLVITSRLEKGKSFAVWMDWSKNIFVNANYDFMGKRKVFYAVSGLLIAAGIASMVTNGFNWGVDFSGGRTYVVKFAEPVDVESVRGALESRFVDDKGVKSTPNVKTYGSKSQLKITTNFLINQPDTAADNRVEASLRDGLATFGGYEITESRKVDPTISDDITKNAITSLTIALALIFLYIAVRFRNWQFGLGGVLSLMHDALIVLGVYSIFYKIMPFSLEIDEAFIAAILTVIGYSINDTVVVYDRIREYLRDHKREAYSVVINKAINSTLGRTMNTSLTTLVVLIVIFVLGGTAIKGFVFALLVGIGVGTYSSVFVASAIVTDLLKGKDPMRQ
ncbi:MAG: protein translocase subunit SecD [Flavobacteriales bacterium]|nr:protein translocase subunit SecD [Flavobacteriales bacterium]